MSQPFIVIRYYQPSDKAGCRGVVHQGVMSTVNTAFFRALSREITVQIIIILAAVMFVFLGLPPVLCSLSIPLTVVIIYVAIYSTHVINSYTLTTDVLDIPRVYMSTQDTGFWVAELFETAFPAQLPKDYRYRIVREGEGLGPEGRGTWRRRIVGTVGICRSSMDGTSAWLRRMAVDWRYRNKGVAVVLLQTAIEFCRQRGYQTVDLVTSECHDVAREMYLRKGFQLRQLYHKKIVGSLIQVLMYELTYELGTRS